MMYCVMVGNALTITEYTITDYTITHYAAPKDNQWEKATSTWASY